MSIVPFVIDRESSTTPYTNIIGVNLSKLESGTQCHEKVGLSVRKWDNWRKIQEFVDIELGLELSREEINERREQLKEPICGCEVHSLPIERLSELPWGGSL